MDLVCTELDGVDLSTRRHAIETTIALTKHAEDEAEAMRGGHADDKQTTAGFDDGTREDFAVGVATGLGVPRDGVRVTGVRAGSAIAETSVTVDSGIEVTASSSSLTDLADPLVDEEEEDSFAAPSDSSGGASESAAIAAIGLQPQLHERMIRDNFHADGSVHTGVLTRREESPLPAAPDALSGTVRTYDGDAEAAAAFASLLTEPAKPLGNEFGPCAMPGVRVDELAATSAVSEEVSAEAPAEAPAEPAPPPAPAVTDNGPLRSTIVVVLHDDDDNGGLWNYVVGVDGGLGEEAEAERRDSGGASTAAAAAAAAIGLQLQLHERMISDYFHADRSVYTGVMTRREESPSPVALDDASATGRTYEDITKSPPPHLWCVVSPLSPQPPILRCTAASLPRFYFAEVPGLRRFRS